MYTSPSITRVIKSWSLGWAGHVARMKGMKNAGKILVRNSEGKRRLGRPRLRWEDNTGMDVREIIR